MPGLDGIAVLSHIRRHDPEVHVPVILITAHHDRTHRLRAFEAGADDVLEKPLDVDILLARVEQLTKVRDACEHLVHTRDALTARTQQLESQRREQHELIQFAAHDIKNQLHVVLAELDWAEQNLDMSAAELAECIQGGSAGATRVRHLVEDLLMAANLEDAAFRLRCEPIFMDGLLSDVLGSYQRRVLQKQLSLRTPHGSRCPLSGDPRLLRRVFENLIDNSLRYTAPGGSICIDVKCGDSLQIVISNDGPSIPLAERERIFQKFVRGGSVVPGFGSVGLGLYFCRRAVEAHGGQIKVVDVPHWPASFLIELPAASEQTMAIAG